MPKSGLNGEMSYAAHKQAVAEVVYNCAGNQKPLLPKAIMRTNKNTWNPYQRSVRLHFEII